MTTITFKGFIEDVRNAKCSDSEIIQLSQIFLEALLLFTEISASKSWYDKVRYDNLKEFKSVFKDGVEEFSLIIAKTKSDEGFDHFVGEFFYEEKNLKILAKIRLD
jgi:hypothetical protein